MAQWLFAVGVNEKASHYRARDFMVTNKLKLLANAMQAYNMRSQATASNLANLETPGYQRMSVEFEELLQERRSTSDDGAALARIKPNVDVADEGPILEDELMNMADTQMRTQLASRALREHFDTLRMGIVGHSG